MKPRKIIVTMEVGSDTIIKELKNKTNWGFYSVKSGYIFGIWQIQVNVVKEGKKKEVIKNERSKN